MDIMPFLLLTLFSLALAICLGVVIRVCWYPQHVRRLNAARTGFCGSSPLQESTIGGPDESRATLPSSEESVSTFEVSVQRPSCWLAVKSRNLLSVKRALGLQKAKPCSWLQGLSRDEKVFISPPIKGWILVFGSALPDPADDVDVCFRFMVGISRKLGHVQLFSANRALQYHAWIRAEKGRVIRAYAWARGTLWNQGARTLAEQEMDMLCLGYFEDVSGDGFGSSEGITGNVDKVPSLAARWSIDPGRLSGRFLEAEFGLAGEPCMTY